MKLNHMICPNCGHDFYIDCAYATCDACYTFFYATQSATRDRNADVYPPQIVRKSPYQFESTGELCPTITVQPSKFY